MTDRTVTVTLKANVKPYMRSMRRARHATLWFRIYTQLPVFIIGLGLGLIVGSAAELMLRAFIVH